MLLAHEEITARVRAHSQVYARRYIYIYISLVPSGSMWQFWGFSGLSSENSLFYSVLRLSAMFEMAHHNPQNACFYSIYSWFLQSSYKTKHFVSVNSISHYVFCNFSGSQNCHIDPEGTTHIYIYIYICFSSSAYILVKKVLKIGEIVHFGQKTTTNFGRTFLGRFGPKQTKCDYFRSFEHYFVKR